MQFVVLAIKLSGKTLSLPRQAMLLFITEHLAGRQSLAQIIDLLAEDLQFPLTRCELGAQFRGRSFPSAVDIIARRVSITPVLLVPDARVPAAA